MRSLLHSAHTHAQAHQGEGHARAQSRRVQSKDDRRASPLPCGSGPQCRAARRVWRLWWTVSVGWRFESAGVWCGRACACAAVSNPPSHLPSPAVVTVVCNDGRVLIGTLRGFDQATNLVLADATERVFSASAGVDALPLGGLHVVRGDNVALVGDTDAAADAAVDWGAVRAHPLPPVTH